MAISTVLHGSDNRTSLKHLERRTKTEEIKFLKCGTRICLYKRLRIPMYKTTYLTIREEMGLQTPLHMT